LQPVPSIDEDPVVLSPKTEEDSVQAANSKITLPPPRIDHETLDSRRPSNPLKAASMVYQVFEQSQTTTYVVDFALLILISWSLHDASEASKEPSAKYHLAHMLLGIAPFIRVFI
jgi:hypothetical protein